MSSSSASRRWHAAIRLGNPLDATDRDGAAHQLAASRPGARLRDDRRASRAARCCSAASRRTTRRSSKGCYVEPTVVRAKSYRDRIAQEEVFGPFVTVLTFSRDEEALQHRQRHRIRPRRRSVDARPVARAPLRARDQERHGLDQHATSACIPASPFGGVGQSGYGREMGFEAMREYTQVKSVWVNVDAQTAALVSALSRPPRAESAFTEEAAVESSSTSPAQPAWSSAGVASQHLARSSCSAPAGRWCCRRPSRRRDAERVCARSRQRARPESSPGRSMHVPIETAREAREAARSSAPTAPWRSAAARRPGSARRSRSDSGLPILAIPTTYAGSEMTPIYGLTEGGLKKHRPRSARAAAYRDLRSGAARSRCRRGSIDHQRHQRDCALRPKGCTPRTATRSWTDGRGGHPRAGRGAAGDQARSGRDIEARATLCTARGCAARCWATSAWHCTTSSATRWAAASICRTRRCTRWCCRMRSPTTLRRSQRPWQRLERALGREHAAAALYDLARNNGAPYSLRALGMAESDLDRAADIAVANPYWNPRPIERAGIRALLQNAWEGVRPE